MKRIGVISDTHGCFDVTLRHFLRDVDEVWHAGDIGTLQLADQIASFKPLRAVWGNIDGAECRSAFSRDLLFECDGVKVLMMHIGGYPRRYRPEALTNIIAARPNIFISGHSHILKVMNDHQYNLLHLNPGAAGNYGIHKVRTALRFKIDRGQIFDMEVGEWPRG
ncbi:MAG: metallophosphoesterase family protein [Rikenellaceae bacterium]